MSSDDELVIYLEGLLKHRKLCKLSGCFSCLTVQEILDSIKFRILHSPIYAETPSSAPSTTERTPKPPTSKRVRVRRISGS